MAVRAKFVVQSKRDSLHWDRSKGTVSTIELHPVSDGSEENKRFFEATPGGKIELGILNAEAAKQFDLGRSYYVDFTPAE